MDILKDILLIVIPSVAVLLAAYFVLKTFLDNQEKMKLLELKNNNRKEILPLQLQAYERLTLFLERIAFENIIPRTPSHGYTAFEYQNLLIQTIRQEFEHNLSQQLYVSSELWEWIKNAKEDAISTINSSAGKIKNEAPAIDLSSMIFENSLRVDKAVRQKALDILKKEAKLLF